MHLMVQGAETIICGPGSVVIVPPKTAQSITADDDYTAAVSDQSCAIVRDGLLLLDAAHGGEGDLRLVCGYIMASISGAFGLLDGIDGPIVENIGDIAFVRDAYRVMLEEISGPGLGTRALTGSLMKACLVYVLRNHFARAEPGSRLLGSLLEPRLNRAVTAVLDKPAAPHTVAGLAVSAGMSRSTFAREFRSAFGMSPMEFVAKTRLRHAAEMLRSTNVPIKMIAGSIGFASAAISAAPSVTPTGPIRTTSAKPSPSTGSPPHARCAARAGVSPGARNPTPEPPLSRSVDSARPRPGRPPQSSPRGCCHPAKMLSRSGRKTVGPGQCPVGGEEWARTIARNQRSGREEIVDPVKLANFGRAYAVDDVVWPQLARV